MRVDTNGSNPYTFPSLGSRVGPNPDDHTIQPAHVMLGNGILLVLGLLIGGLVIIREANERKLVRRRPGTM